MGRPAGNDGNHGRQSRAAPRISDVAALAGVSVGTASKALNGRGQLREQTRERLRAAAEQLGFQPNTVARSLLAGRTYTVGLITTDHYGCFSIPLMRGAEDALGAGQMAAFMCESREDPIREQHYVRTLLGRRVDGLIVAGRRTDARPPLAQHLPIPVVYAFAPSADPADCSVVSDEVAGARAAVEHLLGNGRRRIAHVTGPTGHHSAAVRAESFEATLADHGVQPAGACGSAPGARSGAVRPPRPCWPPTPTSTPSSAAATRSPAAWPTACARAARACLPTSRSSGWTIGRPWPRTAARR